MLNSIFHHLANSKALSSRAFTLRLHLFILSFIRLSARAKVLGGQLLGGLGERLGESLLVKDQLAFLHALAPCLEPDCRDEHEWEENDQTGGYPLARQSNFISIGHLLRQESSHIGSKEACDHELEVRHQEEAQPHV